MNPYPDYEPGFPLDPSVVSPSDPHPARSLADQLTEIFRQVDPDRPIVFVCIGTDRSTGDSLGPLVGSRLRKYSFNDIHLYGTLDDPVHAVNLVETMTRVHSDHPHSFIVGIDACLGQTTSVGSVKIAGGPVKPGSGVNKELPPVGHMHITGIVNVGGFMEYFVLQNTRLNLVMNMAETIAKGIYISLLDCGRLASFSLSPLQRQLKS